MNDPFKKYRHQFLTWKNNNRLQREKEYYSQKFINQGLSIPDDDTLRRVLKKRFPHIVPKANDKLSIIALYHHYNWENEALKPSLEKFGRVRHYDWFNQFNHQRKDWHKLLKAKTNNDLISQINKWLNTETYPSPSDNIS